MRAYLLIVGLVLFTGCASPVSRRDLTQWPINLSVSEEEISTIARQLGERYRMHIVRFDRQQDGSIAVMLADKPNRLHGIVIVFRKVGFHWEEDPKSQGSWIA